MSIKQILEKISKDIFYFGSNSNIDELENILILASDKYYNTDELLLSDTEFDILLDFLRKRHPKSKFLKQVGAPTKNNKIKLDYYLGSMDKVKPTSNKLDIWKKKYKSSFYISDKLDGISGLLIYNDNKIKLMTRGTATEGMDISNLIKYLDLPTYQDIYKKLKSLEIKGIKNYIAFRGEIIISKKNFKKHSKEYKNIRNLVSGLVNSKNKNPFISNDLDLVLYQVVDPIMTFSDQMELIKKLGFNCVYYQKEKEITYPILSQILKQRKEFSQYEVDGIIITDNNIHKLQVDRNPEYAFAYKELLEETFKEAIIEKIEWNISKSGKIMPTVIIKPIDLGGVTISRVTAFNAKYVKDNGLGKNAKIQITRSGDVIPYIIKVISNVEPEMPTIPYKWNKSGVDIETIDISNEQKIRQIYFFFKTLDTKRFGLKLIIKLYENGFDTIEKIIKMKKEDFLTLDNVKDKSANNFYQEIKRIKNTKFPIEKLISASNSLGNNFGSRKAKLLFSNFSDIFKKNINKNKDTKLIWTDKLLKIDGFEIKTINQIFENWDNLLSNLKWINKYFTYEISNKTKQNNNLEYKNWVLTGFRDKLLQEKIEEKGGKISSTVSKNTDIIVVKDKDTLENPTSKITKAKDLGIKIIEKSQIDKFL